MLFKSTRGGGRLKSFEEVVTSAYAEDGGLYIPQELPMLTFEQLCDWSSKRLSFSDICAEIMHIFSGIDIVKLKQMTGKAYAEFNSFDVLSNNTYVTQ